MHANPLSGRATPDRARPASIPFARPRRARPGLARPLAALLPLVLLAGCGSDDDNGGTAAPPPAPSASFKAEIRRTELGIPHVKAEDWRGLGYGYGYAQAEDNLCTMADSFLTYRGERSRHFGADALPPVSSTIGRPRNLDSDFYHRHLVTAEVVAATVDAQPAEVRDLVTGFAAGYNRYVRDLKAGASPAAHAACRSQAWVDAITPEDIYRRMYAANLAGGYANFLAAIANAAPPGAPAAATPATSAVAGDPVNAVAESPTTAAAAAGAAAAAAAKGAPILSRDAIASWQVGGPDGVGSNMIGFGTAATGTASPLLFGNPHWYWRGPDRFYQAQLTLPGKVDVSGVSFLGAPVVMIGFNRDVAWSHTVSTARRFGFFQLSLVPGDPTSYLRDGQPVKMVATPIAVQVRQSDGSIAPVTRTLYRTPHGPIVNLAALNPALGWTPASAFAIRDVNAQNYRTLRTWWRWNQAKSLAAFTAIQREEISIPWVNTVAVGRDSAQAWYADIGAVPNVTADLVASCTTQLGAALAAGLPRVPVLDGSRSACDWRTDPDSVQPGALGLSKLPSLMRDDYVANMNDSYWITNPAAPLSGFPEIIGPAGTEPLSLRTRLGHRLIAQRLAGTDGYPGNRATVDAIKAMVLDSRVLSAELFKAQALSMVCAAPQVALAADPLTGEAFSPARTVEVAAACAALQAWNGRGDIESRGAHLWDEFWVRAQAVNTGLQRASGQSIYAVPFDPADPIGTPRDLRTDTATAAALQQAFGAAVLKVQQSGFAVDARRGEVLYATRGTERIPLYGGCGAVGYFTIACSERRIEQGGYSMDDNPNGNSYIQIVTFPSADAVEAHTFLTFSLSDDPASPHHADYTRRYSAKDWLRVPFTDAQIAASPGYRTQTVQE